ncbi:hypothetical protein H5410_021543 [Solanum commersonii]|uniref:Uncharacterized protein n=1 Tax=Solanum commersonii TaxID=4109 RepID=A0A9J5ZHI1_SOLCO|nr:hypothetical protein H5410_021543 [Solanum commersonii]
MLKFQVFQVLVEAWTLRRKTEQIEMKRTRNGILRITEFNLARKGAVGESSSRRSVLRSSTVPHNDPECEDAKGKKLKAMS